MFQIKFHWENYESMQLSHILLVATYYRTHATSGCLFTYLLCVWRI